MILNIDVALLAIRTIVLLVMCKRCLDYNLTPVRTSYRLLLLVTYHKVLLKDGGLSFVNDYSTKQFIFYVDD